MDARGRPETVSELYPRQWLRADDLGGKAHDLTIRRADVETLRQFDGTTAPRVVLTFEGARMRLVCNKTQAKALAGLTGSDRFADWAGHRVRLAPATAHNGKGTIAITKGVEDGNGRG
jgi:hypothetical protein